MAFLLYFLVQYSADSLSSFDSNGYVTDLSAIKTINGFILLIIMTLVVYIDTRTHTYFFEIGVVLIMTFVPTVAEIFAENYAPGLTETHLVYTDNFTLRFWLTIFLFCMSGFLFKLAISTFWI